MTSFNLGLQRLAGYPLSHLIYEDPSAFPQERFSPRGTVVTVFNPTVCQQCLEDGLVLMKKYQTDLIDHGLGLVAVVGETGKGTRTTIALLRDSKELDYHFEFVKAGHLESTFPFVHEARYIDEPIFLFIDGNFRVASSFKPDCKRMPDLESWFRSLLNKQPSV
ncbi:MAG TPA: hypothetical protein VLU25_16975 [Acidobacteriota bacterium]|nr:hypothetical protein [Acidobacteriota bacterium]